MGKFTKRTMNEAHDLWDGIKLCNDILNNTDCYSKQEVIDACVARTDLMNKRYTLRSIYVDGLLHGEED